MSIALKQTKAGPRSSRTPFLVSIVLVIVAVVAAVAVAVAAVIVVIIINNSNLKFAMLSFSLEIRKDGRLGKVVKQYTLSLVSATSCCCQSK